MRIDALKAARFSAPALEIERKIKMKIAMTLLVRDEEDILRENIKFHLAQGVDFIIATDNRSTDSTKDILKEYETQGKLFYIYENRDNYNQHAWVTKMARMAYLEHNANWVINNDADEFWWPKKGTLRDVFLSLPANANIIKASRKNFLFRGDSAAISPFYNHMIYKELNSLNSLGKPLPGKVAHIGSDKVLVKQGNHGIDGIGNQVILKDKIDILHFPIRTSKQFINKIKKGGEAYSNNQELGEAVGKTWRELYKQYQNTGNLNAYLEDQTYSNNRLMELEKKGHLVIDTRLKDFLGGL